VNNLKVNWVCNNLRRIWRRPSSCVSSRGAFCSGQNSSWDTFACGAAVPSEPIRSTWLVPHGLGRATRETETSVVGEQSRRHLTTTGRH